MSDERCRHDMRPEWCQDCREHEAAVMGCGVDAGEES